MNKACISPAPGLKPGAKNARNEFAIGRSTQIILVPKDRGATSILGDRDAKDNQSQQDTEWLKPEFVVWPVTILPSVSVSHLLRISSS